MKYLQIRHGYQFTNLNRNSILKLADVFLLDYINQTDVLQMIILFWVFVLSHLCCWIFPICNYYITWCSADNPRWFSVYEYFIFFGGLPGRPQNPHSWRSSLSLFVWRHSFALSSLAGPYLLTTRCRDLLEQLNGLQLVKKFPAFHGTRRFITAFTSVRHLSLSLASPIQSIYPHPTS